MSVVSLRQSLVDRLLVGPIPPRDEFFWSDREAGFGLRRKAGSKRVAWVYQWRDPYTGKSHRLTLGDAAKVSLADARQAMRAAAGRIAGGSNPLEERREHRSSPTFGDLTATYFDSIPWRKKALSTRLGDQRRVQLYLLPALGSRKLCEITASDLRKLAVTLADPIAAGELARKGGAVKQIKRGGEGGARRTLRVLKAIFSFAVTEGIIEASDNPAASVKVSGDGRRDVVLDEGGYARLWAALDEVRAEGGVARGGCDVIAMIALTGARRGEILNLRWRHVQLHSGRIVIPACETKGGKRTGEPRVIALPEEALAILRSYYAGYPFRTPPDHALVFQGRREGSPVSLQRTWDRIRQLAELPAGICLHSLRHGVATLLAADGCSAPQIAQALGHASWQTSQRYVHAVDKSRVELAARAAGLVRRPELRVVSAA